MRQSERRNILRWDGQAAWEDSDELAVEEPLEIRIQGRPVTVTMRTPGQDRELAAGFLLSEGLIRGFQPRIRQRGCNIIEVSLPSEVDFAALTRHVFASSSCGLCGKTTIESVHAKFPPIESAPAVDAPILAALPERMREAQGVFDRTGGLHAAAVFDTGGNLVVAREDVGRHNAVDKVLGYALLHGLLPLERHILMVSGRASFEIVQKALAARVPVVAAVSAPSSLAVEFARANGQTLVGFLRRGRMNVYAGVESVRFPADAGGLAVRPESARGGRG